MSDQPKSRVVGMEFTDMEITNGNVTCTVRVTLTESPGREFVEVRMRIRSAGFDRIALLCQSLLNQAMKDVTAESGIR